MHATPNVIFNSIGKYRSDALVSQCIDNWFDLFSVLASNKLSINSGLHQSFEQPLAQQTPPQVE